MNVILQKVKRKWDLGEIGCKSTELESPSSTLLSGPYPLSFWRNDLDDIEYKSKVLPGWTGEGG